MTTLHGVFRKLLLRNIRKLTSEDLDRYDSLLALRLELIHQRDILPKNGTVAELASSKKTEFNRLHDFYPLRDKNGLALPGRVALNVFGAEIFTYIHEFAHAMCSVFHGEIVDEYIDGYVLENHLERKQKKVINQNGNKEDPSQKSKDDFKVIPWHSINRIHKNPELLHNGHVIGVHKEFATYNCTRFHSDLDHPSAEADWVGYYPERTPQGFTCAMDRGTGLNHFDPLISAFMYDRILAKLNRKKLNISQRPVRPKKKNADRKLKLLLLAFGHRLKAIGNSLYRFYKYCEKGLLRILETKTPNGEIQPGEVPTTKGPLDELIEKTTAEAHQIIAPHRERFEVLHQLWVSRREYAFQQEDILQIPTTPEQVRSLTAAFLKYKGRQIITSIILTKERGKDLVTAVKIAWDRFKEIFINKEWTLIVVITVGCGGAITICWYLIFR